MCLHTLILRQKTTTTKKNASSCRAVSKDELKFSNWLSVCHLLKVQMSSTFALRRKRARTSTRLSKLLQNRNQRLFHSTDEHNTYHDTQVPHPLLTGDGASKQRSDDNKWWQSKRSSSFDEAQDKAQTPSQRLVNDKTVFSASFGVIFKKKHHRWPALLTKTKKTKQKNSLMLFILFVVDLCHIELWKWQERISACYDQ